MQKVPATTHPSFISLSECVVSSMKQKLKDVLEKADVQGQQ